MKVDLENFCEEEVWVDLKDFFVFCGLGVLKLVEK